MHEFIRAEISNVTGKDIRLCQIVDAHYFKGRHSALESDSRNTLYGERVFDDILMYENVTSHYLPLRYDTTGRPTEKGIDVWLALEAYELAIYKRFDILVLIASDGDYVPLVRKLNTVSTQVMLISWDFKYMDEHGKTRETRTSQQLLEEVSFPIAMHEKIESRISNSDILIKNLFVENTKKKQNNKDEKSTINHIGENVNITNFKESTILSVHNGYGFIKEGANNVFFYYTTLENKNFNDIESGMKVKYIAELDEKGKNVAKKVYVIENDIVE